MICGASIAKRDGTHRICLLPDQHEDECSPLVLVDLGRPPRWPPASAELLWFAIAHVGALLAVVIAVAILSLGSGAVP